MDVVLGVHGRKMMNPNAGGTVHGANGYKDGVTTCVRVSEETWTQQHEGDNVLHQLVTRILIKSD